MDIMKKENDIIKGSYIHTLNAIDSFKSLGTPYSLNELQHEVGDKLGRGDDEGARLVKRLRVVLHVTNFPHQRRQSSEAKVRARAIIHCASSYHTRKVAFRILYL